MPKVTIIRPDGLLTETARVALATYAEALGVTLAVGEDEA